MKPYLFQLPDWLPLMSGRPLFSYGVMLGISFITGWSLCVYLNRRDGMDARIASTAMFVIVVSSLIGARGLHFVSSPTARFTIANFLKFDEGGLVAWGGILGALGGLWGYLTWKKHDWWTYIDNAAGPVALGLGITRVGCFLFGCDYGTRSAGPLSIRFPRWDDPEVYAWIKRSAPAYTDHAPEPTWFGVFSDHVYPVQLYESLVGLVAFSALLFWLPRKRFHGQIMLAFLGYYAVTRFLLETMRGDADRGDDVAGLGVSTSQLIGILIVLTVSALWWWRKRYGLYDAPGTAAWAGGPPRPGAQPAPDQQAGRKRGKKRK